VCTRRVLRHRRHLGRQRRTAHAIGAIGAIVTPLRKATHAATNARA
jgi:hypothetical protein